MKLQQNVQTVKFTKGHTKFEFLPTGDLLEGVCSEILINQLLGNTVDGSINNIFMRIYEEDNMQIVPLMGVRSESKFAYTKNQAIWTGEAHGVSYKVTFVLMSESVWFWSVDVSGQQKIVDFVYGQDISLGNKGATLTNELYVSQYLDNKVFEGECGYVASARQNQSQNGNFPYLQQGAIDTKIVGFSTDGMQFFGKDYKGTHRPIALDKDLPNTNYQFELSYTALQTEKIHLEEKAQVLFYGVVKPNYETAITKIDFVQEVKEAYEEFIATHDEKIEDMSQIRANKNFAEPFTSEFFTQKEIEAYFPDRKIEEYEEDQLLSFFQSGHSHVVLAEKELKTERPHGHIITSGVSQEHLNEGLITSTTYMYGVFNAQVVVGNTSFNKFLSTPRGLLNIQKHSGQRIYVKIDEEYRILTLPAAYELGMNYSKWYYKLEDDLLLITSYTAAGKSDLILEIESEKGKPYEFLITNQLVMGEQEFQQASYVDREGNTLIISPDEQSYVKSIHPEIHYNMHILGADFVVSDDRIFYEDEQTRNGTLMTIQTSKSARVQVVMEGRLTKESHKDQVSYTAEEEVQKFNNLYQKLTCGFKLDLPEEKQQNIEKINEIFWWYTHNAMTHYAVPHGLEQPGGAAWGTRDVCQGPLEYFFATQHYNVAKEIIVEIFSHQFMESGEWPQWFMFDKYNLQQDDCHGDVVFWPLKVVGDYITITGDDTILDTPVVYRHVGGKISEHKETILEHIKRAVQSIKGRFLYDTALISYAGGDWDDTLQPANKALKEKLVSSWTVALAYQALQQLGKIIVCKEKAYGETIEHMAKDIKEAFDEYLIKDEVIAGFVYCQDSDKIEYMLHPEDKKTGIQYRLLPMTRSVISELVDHEQALKNVDLIEQHLMCPDGVRLMNHPATYKGGVIEFFQRAEQAANVGREIGLQYVHAHIRFIEAMAKLGRAKDAWKALMTINPINIKENVPNAALRQSNTYFSSSDGAFDTRYEFQENFDKLRTGEVEVKGGWRIYSSGPGIYLNQLVSSVLGLRVTANEVVIDPVLPISMDGLEWSYEYNKRPVTFVYHLENEGEMVKKVVIDGAEVPAKAIYNLYRQEGMSIDKKTFEKYLDKNQTVHIYIG